MDITPDTMNLEPGTNFRVVETGQRYLVTGINVILGGLGKTANTYITYREYPSQSARVTEKPAEDLDRAFRDGDIVEIKPPQELGW